MLSSHNIAFKEWAVVCAALGAGKQTIILRKGGIDEGSEGFRVKHREFWLLPTRFHQDPSQLASGAEQFWQDAKEFEVSASEFRVELYDTVEKIFEIRDLSFVQKLAGFHILSDATIEQRFQYRRPGLFVILARIFRSPVSHTIADSPYIAGCKSWVELPQQLATDGMQ